MKYFAYGSNLLLKKMREIVPSAAPNGVANLSGYRLKFHKKSSVDGSAKCDVFRTGDERDVAYGVVYEIDEIEEGKLNNAEGAGYEKVENIEVESDKGPVTVFMYVARSECVESSLKPYSWYKQYVLEGAQEQGLPKSYILEHVAKVEAIEDPDKERDREKRTLLANF